VILVATKTASSVATILPPPIKVDRLRNHLERQAAIRAVEPFGDSLVFVTDDGLAIIGSWFTQHFRRLLVQAGLPMMRLHDKRLGAAGNYSMLVSTLASSRSCSAMRPAAG
jgi:hypothetical protein